MRTIVAGLAALLFSTPVIAAPAVAAASANPFNDRIKALGLADRNGALRRAVTLENQRCGRLAKSVELGDYGNLGLWQVHCVPGGDYGVFVGSDGTVQVRTCADMASLKLPKCGKLD